jgi:hypothetical protein
MFSVAEISVETKTELEAKRLWPLGWYCISICFNRLRANGT